MNLLAAGAWVLDVVFFAVLFIGIMLGVASGFLRCVCKIAGTIFSIALAVSFCVPFKNDLESWFGLQTALTNAIGNAKAASWLSVAIAFIALAVLIRLGAWILGHVGTSLIDKSKAMRTMNRFLGGIMGLVGAAAVIFLLLAIMFWISAPGVDSFISQSTVVGAIYRWDYFRYAARFSFL